MPRAWLANNHRNHMCIPLALPMQRMQSSGALYGMLLAPGGMAVAAERQHKGLAALEGVDVMLLDNFVACSAAIRCAPDVTTAGGAHVTLWHVAGKAHG